MLTPRQAQWRTWQSPWTSLPREKHLHCYLPVHPPGLRHCPAGFRPAVPQVTFTDSDVDCHHPLLVVHLELPEATEAEPQVPAPGLQATAEPEQWPVMEELFRKVVPSQCLGSSWCKRIKLRNEHLAPAIQATVDHFQRVVNFITTTCLRDPSRTARDRARLVEHWIQVAQECNILMNFSLHTVISALQKTSISRLENTWDEVSRESSENFKELYRKDKSLSRELMTKSVLSRLTRGGILLVHGQGKEINLEKRTEPVLPAGAPIMVGQQNTQGREERVIIKFRPARPQQ
ncbi:ral guanine nucleotide dissociation stimulator-like isoform X6 [Equus asinus]|uniref:ral guanine nucleotide dissociation stimulator-like isoform X6 n=1 Tax=Equus asinus TaxID=9793 RepID=UPI0038F7CEEE